MSVQLISLAARTRTGYGVGLNVCVEDAALCHCVEATFICFPATPAKHWVRAE